jgi:hypothetical protein
MVSLKFWKKKEKDIDFGTKNIPPMPDLPKMIGDTNTENMKAKMDLVLTQIQSLNVRYETLNERLQRIEQMIQEIYRIAKA